MADRENNPEKKLDELLSGYKDRLPEPPLENLWENIEGQLQADAAVTPNEGNTDEYDEAFLSAYADGELNLNDPGVAAFEQQMNQSPQALQMINTFQSVSDTVRQYGYRAEEACTLDVTQAVMTRFQEESAGASNVASLEEHRVKKAWLAIPMAAAAAVLFVVIAGGPNMDQLALKSASPEAQQEIAFAQSHDEFAERNRQDFALSEMEAGEFDDGLLASNLSAEKKSELRTEESPAFAADDPNVPQDIRDLEKQPRRSFAAVPAEDDLEGFADKDRSILSSTRPVSRFDLKRKQQNEIKGASKITFASAETAMEPELLKEDRPGPSPVVGGIAAGAGGERPAQPKTPAPKSREKSGSKKARKNTFVIAKASVGEDTSSLDSNFRNGRRGANGTSRGAFLNQANAPGKPSTSVASGAIQPASKFKVADRVSRIPTAEEYVMMYCNEPVPDRQSDSTSFMQTCVTGI